MRKIVIAVLWLIVFIGCSSTSKKTVDTKGVPTTLLGLLPKPAEEKPIEETPPEKVPSSEQNRAYKDTDGFPDYIIGAGDLLTISMLRAGGQESVDIRVPPNGKISFSFLDNIPVIGRTTGEVTEEMAKLLEAFVKRPRITVVVKEYYSKKAFLLGEIARIEGLPQSGPGVYPLKGKTTLLNTLISIGGHTPKADLSRVELTRGGKIYYINLYKMLTQGGEGMDIILENGDRVVVPELPTFKEEKLVTNRVYVLGEVSTPGLLEVKTDITMLEAISKAGGVKLTAAKSKARIVRGDIRNPEVIPIDLKRLIDKSDLSLNVKLQNGDVIYVPTTFLGKFSNSFNQIIPILNAFTYPAIYRDLYTTGGIGVLDTGARPTGGAAGGRDTGVTTQTLLSR